MNPFIYLTLNSFIHSSFHLFIHVSIRKYICSTSPWSVHMFNPSIHPSAAHPLSYLIMKRKMEDLVIFQHHLIQSINDFCSAIIIQQAECIGWRSPWSHPRRNTIQLYYFNTIQYNCTIFKDLWSASRSAHHYEAALRLDTMQELKLSYHSACTLLYPVFLLV